MNEKQTFNNYIFTKYYIFAALFQTVWSVSVLGFTIFLVCFFQNYWVLFSLVLLFLKPYRNMEWTSKEEKLNDRKSYGTNNPS